MTDEERRACYHAAVEARCANEVAAREEQRDRRRRPRLPELEHLFRRPLGCGTASFDTITLTDEELIATVTVLRFKAEWYRAHRGPTEQEALVYGRTRYSVLRRQYEVLADALSERQPL